MTEGRSCCLRADADHQLVRRTITGDDRKTTTRFGWDARGKLKTVDLPDKTRITYVHDMFARRIRSTVTKNKKQVEREDWRWDHDRLSQTIRRRAGKAGDPIVEERTYAYAPQSLLPLAHRVSETSSGVRTDRPWVFYVTEASLRPQLLVDGSGKVLSSLSGQAWGAAEPSAGSQELTPMRFAGHFEDAQTGLFYNRHRMYDPTTGRYLSPEPIGLEGGLQPFGYAQNNPIERVDPNGLEGMNATATGGGVTGTGTAVGRSGRGARRERTLNPIVREALLDRGDSLESARNDTMRHPASCAEPQAISDYLTQRGIDENSSDERIREALSQMELEAHENDGTQRAPCQNCSQMLANLHARYGAPTSANIIAGSTTHSGTNSLTFTPPSRTHRANGTPNHTSLP